MIILSVRRRLKMSHMHGKHESSCVRSLLGKMFGLLLRNQPIQPESMAASTLARVIRNICLYCVIYTCSWTYPVHEVWFDMFSCYCAVVHIMFLMTMNCLLFSVHILPHLLVCFHECSRYLWVCRCVQDTCLCGCVCVLPSSCFLYSSSHFCWQDTEVQIIATNIDKKNRKGNPLGCFHVLAKVTVCISLCVHQKSSGLKVQVSVYSLQK